VQDFKIVNMNSLLELYRNLALKEKSAVLYGIKVVPQGYTCP